MALLPFFEFQVEHFQSSNVLTSLSAVNISDCPLQDLWI